MQRNLLATDLSSINQSIAALCYERTQVQRKQHEFRHCPRDSRHDSWDAELKEMAERRTRLAREQKVIIKQSIDCGVTVGRTCI